MKNKLTGVILAGGKNSRMGTDKGLLQVKGRKIIDQIAEVLKPLVCEIIIVSNADQYNYMGFPVVPDIFRNCGPMGGICTALSVSKTDQNLIVGCDMPFLNTHVLEYIVQHSRDSEITVPQHGNQTEPLCAIYHKVGLYKWNVLLENGEYKLLDALKYFKVEMIAIPENMFGSDWFVNINTPDEYEKIK